MPSFPRPLAATSLLAASLLALTACSSTPDESAAPTTPATSTTREATVIRVVDGDTLRVADVDSGAETTVRILAIDTPEIKAPGKPVECGGYEASAFAERLLVDQTVTLTPDPTQDVKDHFDRSLFYVDLHSPTTHGDYSTLAAEAGMGRAYVFDPARPPQRIAAIQAAEARAKAAKRGLWSCPKEGR